MYLKDRKPWKAGILTVLAIGLGHLYAGRPKKGFLLFLGGQAAILGLGLLLTYYFLTATTLLIAIGIGFGFLIYCIMDAVKIAKGQSGYILKKYNKGYVYLSYFFLAAFIIQPTLNASIKYYFIQAYKMPSASLRPTLLVGDYILVKKYFSIRKGVHKGDMIIFKYPEDPSKDFTKRIIAKGGETIEIIDKKVLINGTLLEEPYVIHTDSKIFPKGRGGFSQRDNFGPLTIQDGAFFVMGDNRDESNDSRFWGVVGKDAVIGKAYKIYWSWDRDNAKPRWNRIGKAIE